MPKVTFTSNTYHPDLGGAVKAGDTVEVSDEFAAHLHAAGLVKGRGKGEEGPKVQPEGGLVDQANKPPAPDPALLNATDTAPDAAPAPEYRAATTRADTDGSAVAKQTDNAAGNPTEPAREPTPAPLNAPKQAKKK